MATLKLNKNNPASPSADKPGDRRTPVRGINNFNRARPTLEQAQGDRAERQAAHEQRRSQDTPPDRRGGPGPRDRNDRNDRGDRGGDRGAHGAPGGHGKPFGDRPRRDADRPRFEHDRARHDSDRPRPYGDRPQGDRPRPQGDRPYGDRPRPQGDRPQGDRPYGDRPRFDDRRPQGQGDRPRFDDRRPQGQGDRPRFDDRRPQGQGDRPRFDDRRPQGQGDRPRFEDRRPQGGPGQGDRPRFDNDRPRFQGQGFGERPRHEGDRPRFDDRRPQDQGHGDRPRYDDRRPQGQGHGDRPRFDDRRPAPQGQRMERDERPEWRDRPERPERPRTDRPQRDPSVPRQQPPERKADLADGERLSKRMSELGLASRREADEWIEAGWVMVDGRMAELGQRVGPDVQIEVDPAARNQQAQRVTILINKPIGYVSGQAEDGYEPAALLIKQDTHWDEDASKVPWAPGHSRGLAPAGRLDIDSTGLLVLTQDGRIARHLIGEDSNVEKEYLVRVAYEGGDPERHPQHQLEERALAALNFGLELDGVQLKPAKVSWANEDQLRFVLREGRKRQIRRMCELVGLKVLALKRVRIGRIPLGNLPVGQWRYLAPWERF